MQIKKYFGSADFWKTALRLALPIALQNLLMSSLSLVDTLMLGQMGSITLSGVGMAAQWSWLMNIVFFGLYSGGSVFISQYWGAGEKKEISKIYGIMLTHTAAISILFFCVAFFFPEYVIRMFNSDKAVIAAGASYLRIAAFSYLPTALSGCASTLLRSTENVRLPMISSMLVTVFNAILNWILIFGKFGFPRLEEKGAAIASVISSVLGVIVIYTISIIQKNIAVPRIKDLLGFDRKLLFYFYKISVPVLLNETFWALGTFCYNLIFGHLGYENFAALTICRTVEGLAFVFFVGLCTASAVMIGKSIGAGDAGEAYNIALRFAVIIPIIGLIVGIGIILLREQFIYLFNLNGSLNAATTQSAREILFIYGIWLCPRMIPYIQIVGIFRPGGDTITGMKYDLGMVWCVALPVTLMTAFLFHLPFTLVFFLMYVAEDTIKVFLCLRRFISKKWIRKLV